MLIRRIFRIVGLMMCLAVFGTSRQKEIKYVSIKPTSPASGAEMYKAYCAVCHGMDGKGGGPAADALKVLPPDLTTLARRSGGIYPSDHVRRAIEGEPCLPSHGAKEMPVWGHLFWRMSQGHTSEVQLRVVNLSKYVELMQAK
jgi:mono/diheme cytochrome c family protein